MAGNSGVPGLKVTSKTAAILLALTTGGEHTLSTLAYQTRLPVSTVYRLLHDLAPSPVVERTADGRYQPETFTARGRTATWARPRSTNSHRC